MMQRSALAIVAAAAAGACRSARAFSGLLRSAPAAAGLRPLSTANAAAPTGDALGVCRVSLDFNEVRLVGRVSKVLDMNARNATFLLTTSHTVRKRSDTDAAGTLVKERDLHLVFGSGGQNGVNSGDPNWHLQLYPGSQVEIVGSLDYRLVRQSGSDNAEAEPSGTPQQVQARYEPIIRLTRLAAAGESDAVSPHHEQHQQHQQHQQQQHHQQQQKPWQQKQWQPRRQQRESRRHEDSNDGDSDEGWGGPRYEANRGQEKDGY